MKKIIKIGSFCFLSFYTFNDAKAEKLDFDYSGKSAVYYGIMDTKKKASDNNMPNRLVNRTDVKANLEYSFNDEYKIGIYNNSALIFKQHDRSYRDGELRFYNNAAFDSPYGKVFAGQSFNVAHQFHKGAKDFSPMGITDTNLGYFLSNPNSKNGMDSVSFLTPKSTAIMNDGRALKVGYITPEFYNTLVGFSYTPDNANRRGMVSRYAKYEKKEDGYVVAAHNELDLDFADMYTSLGYGIFNRTDKELSLGVTLARGGWTVATGYKNAYVDGKKNGITKVTTSSRTPAFFDNYRESEAWDFSVGYEIGPFKTNIAYLHTKAKNTSNKDDTVIFANSYSINKWVEVYAIGGYINARGLDKSPSNRNKGYAGITGLAINF